MESTITRSLKEKRRETYFRRTSGLSGKTDQRIPDRFHRGCMSENDWAGWKKLTDRIGNHCQLVGDDLFVTNVEFLSRGIKEGCGNSILIKVNQIGSLTETLNAIEMLTAMDIRPLLHTVPVRRKTLRSPISLSLPIADRSRRDH